MRPCESIGARRVVRPRANSHARARPSRSPSRSRVCARARPCSSLVGVQRLLRSVDTLLKDLGAGSAAATSSAASAHASSRQPLGSSGGGGRGPDRAGGGFGSAAGQRGDLSSLFGDDGAGGRAAWEAEVAHRSVVHAPVDRDLDFRAANTAQRSEELIKVLANWGCVAGGREEFIDLFSAVREVGVEEGGSQGGTESRREGCNCEELIGVCACVCVCVCVCVCDRWRGTYMTFQLSCEMLESWSKHR